MSAPIVTPATRDFGVRTPSVYDLEVTLQKFLDKILDPMLLDNPSLNEQQPDTIPFDPIERAQTLLGKIKPRIIRGRIPRTVTGEIAVDKLPDFPHVIVQAVKGKIEQEETHITVRLLFAAYDENPDSHGYQDVLNMIEAAALPITSFGQGALDKTYPIVLPIEWNLIEAETFPHFLGEMVTMWQLPSGRPMPDLSESVIPGEQLEARFEFASEMATRVTEGITAQP